VFLWLARFARFSGRRCGLRLSHFLPTGVIVGLVAYLAVNRLSTLGEVLGILVVSTACDFLSVLALRRFAEAVTNTLSLARILLEIITLAAIILLIFGLPWETQVHYTHLQEFTANQKYEAPAGAAAMLLLMNITTVLLCMLPIFVLTSYCFTDCSGHRSAGFSIRSHPGAL
jgi:hypothetical protein